MENPVDNIDKRTGLSHMGAKELYALARAEIVRDLKLNYPGATELQSALDSEEKRGCCARACPKCTNIRIQCMREELSERLARASVEPSVGSNTMERADFTLVHFVDSFRRLTDPDRRQKAGIWTKSEEEYAKEQRKYDFFAEIAAEIGLDINLPIQALHKSVDAALARDYDEYIKSRREAEKLLAPLNEALLAIGFDIHTPYPKYPGDQKGR